MRPAALVSILRGDPNAIVNYGHYLFVVGLSIIAVSLLAGGLGILTGFLAAGLGGAGVMLTNWRTERGLWMLAGIYLLLNGFIYICWCVGQIRDVLHGIRPESIVLFIDVTIGTWLLVATIRFLVVVVRKNYSFSRSLSD